MPGQNQALTVPSGQSRSFTYDDQGRLTQIANLASGGANLATYAYGYDYNYTTSQNTMLGQRVSQTATVPSQGFSASLSKYEYDPRYQLVKATYPAAAPFSSEVDSWTYDAIGNRLSNTVNGLTKYYIYQTVAGRVSQQMTSDGAATYGYDSNGSLTSKTHGIADSWGITWDQDNRIQSTGNAFGVSWTYSYDYSGRRIVQILQPVSGSPTTTTYAYDGTNRSEDGTAVIDGGIYVYGADVDMPLAVSQGGVISYYATDGLGSVSLLISSAGGVQNSYVYDAWGQSRSSTEVVINPFTFTGREQSDGWTLNYRARYYQPSVGRFLSEDPMGRRSGDDHLYRYVLNTPVMSTDPSGMFSIDGSCDCPKNGPPPGAPPNWGSQLLQAGIKACQDLSRITDPKLRACMKRTCDSGTIECLPPSRCPKDVAGHTDFIFFGVINRTSGICVNNWTDVAPKLPDVVLHEFAHGCNWGHGQGKGVPGNTGAGWE